MSGPLALLGFQDTLVEGVLKRLTTARELYDALSDAGTGGERQRQTVAKHDGAVVLYAPTGAGKTLMAAEILARFDPTTPTLWFWFSPFAGLVEQARQVLRLQAPALRLLDLDSDRRLDTISAGGVFVTTWQSVATANQSGRLARSRSDSGQSLDDLLTLARAQGLRIGCVVDEAHHGFHKAKEARTFFTDVLKPDYALMMTATPRDADALQFERDTGYRIGDPDDWATVARQAGVDIGLLKRGVKVVRFIAPDNDVAALVDFERNALQQCTQMHRHIQQQLTAHGVPLTPLMLVQVPDGNQAMQDAKALLVRELGFAESAVRIHTAKEPDPDLIALAYDPTVEVLIFKMAVALGFDAPRAFTLAALRGARDKDFGIQVIGRIMRVHAQLRGRHELPPELHYGFVFLANAEAQEGLLSAGKAIDALSTHAPTLGTQTVVTVIGARHEVQVLRSGETASLLIGAEGIAPEFGGAESASPALLELAQEAQQWGPALGLFADDSQPPAPGGDTASRGLSQLLSRDAARQLNYRLRDDVPPRIVSEYLPPVEGRVEQRVADHVDFSPAVLGAMHQTLAKLLRVETELFTGIGEDRESYVLAQLDAGQVAHKVDRQIGLFDVDARALLTALTERFCARLPDAGFAVPEDEESLDRALDIVLVRHPELLRNAFKLARMQQVGERDIELPGVLGSAESLASARRNAYGVMPNNFDSNDERDIAELLDRCDEVLWWHRNPSGKPHSLALYRWDDGAAFHPDFVVAFKGRECAENIALVEVKGKRGWGDLTDVAKANGPAHPHYGRCIFVGREKVGKFQLLKPQGERLTPYALFDPAQLRWVEK
ncbi:MAG: DEAD/DEAH box helicase [Lysobacterales bacterium]